MGDENKIRDAADAIKGVVEAVPVYQDALQPAAKEVGKSLATVAKAVHAALFPVTAVVWGYEKIAEYLEQTLAEKLKHVPEERITTPNPTVAGPAMEALRFAAHEPQLREMYASLLATAMDSDSAAQAHPAYVEIIRQMTPDEARVMKAMAVGAPYPMIDVGEVRGGQLYPAFFPADPFKYVFVSHFTLLPYDAECGHLDLFSVYLDNLRRFGLVEVKENYPLAGGVDYGPLETHPDVVDACDSRGILHPGFRRGAILLTDMGRQFCEVCVP